MVPIGCIQGIWKIFSSIYSPNLESLVLANGAADDLDLLFQMGILTGVLFQPLKRLEIWDTQWMGLTALDMRAIPNTAHVKLIRRNVPAFLRCLRETRDPVASSHHYYEPIDDVMSEDGDFAVHINADDEFTRLICTVVTTRQKIGAPFNILALDSDLLAGIPGTRQVWLREQGTAA